MSNNDEPRSEEGRDAARRKSLQVYADTLAAVILSSRMMHGVTVALSVRSPEGEDEVIMASNTSTVGKDQNDQAGYAILHMRHIEKGAHEAIAQVEEAAEKALRERNRGAVN